MRILAPATILLIASTVPLAHAQSLPPLVLTKAPVSASPSPNAFDDFVRAEMQKRRDLPASLSPSSRTARSSRQRAMA